MTNTTRFFASLIFTAISVFLVSYTWVPPRDSLHREEGKVSNIAPQSNTWHEVEIVTSSGIRVTCRTRRGWPLVGPDRCPLEKFEHYQGQAVTVLHDDKRPYEVSIGSLMVVGYSAHRQIQAIAFALAGLMLMMALWVWKRQ